MEVLEHAETSVNLPESVKHGGEYARWCRRQNPRQSTYAPVHEQFGQGERSKSPLVGVQIMYAAGRSSVNFASVKIN